MADPVFVTTAIPYVNAAPHVGFAYELVLADALARHHRARGADVRFQTGADEHSLKNARAAEAAGVPVEAFVAEHAARFEALRGVLDLSTDDFVRTSADPRHRPAVERLWRAVAAAGGLYRRAYTGAYCPGCEQFLGAADLVQGRCPEHRRPPDTVREENWFFRLCDQQSFLRNAIRGGALRIEPESHRRAVLDFVEGGLEDISVSRDAARARGWGLEVPEDPSQVIYVWFDALANYLSGLGYGSDEEAFARFWRPEVRRIHVLGKGVARFHAVYWPAFLAAAGLPAPTDLFVHGYVTVDGQKIGKSLGNAVAPEALVDRFGSDGLRYFLLRHLHADRDGDLSADRIAAARSGELAAGLGNLVRRVSTLIERRTAGWVRAPAEASARTIVEGLGARVHTEVEAFRLHAALDEIFSAVAALNRLLSAQAPWAESDTSRRAGHLFGAAEALRVVARELTPFLPGAGRRIHEDLGFAAPSSPGESGWGAVSPDRPVRTGPVLFPR